jgi:hypothetical protein
MVPGQTIESLSSRTGSRQGSPPDKTGDPTRGNLSKPDVVAGVVREALTASAACMVA